MAEVSLVKLLSDECHWSLPVISKHWFREWVSAVRQQAITWANVDPDLCHHMVSLGHNEFLSWILLFSIWIPVWQILSYFMETNHFYLLSMIFSTSSWGQTLENDLRNLSSTAESVKIVIYQFEMASPVPAIPFFFWIVGSFFFSGSLCVT